MQTKLTETRDCDLRGEYKIRKDYIQRGAVCIVHCGRGEGKVEDIYEHDVHYHLYLHLQPDRRMVGCQGWPRSSVDWWGSTFNPLLWERFKFCSCLRGEAAMPKK
jgi:hypothetical protein